MKQIKAVVMQLGELVPLSDEHFRATLFGSNDLPEAATPMLSLLRWNGDHIPAGGIGMSIVDSAIDDPPEGCTLTPAERRGLRDWLRLAAMYGAGLRRE